MPTLMAAQCAVSGWVLIAPVCDEAGQRVVQGQVAAADRRGAGAAVGLQHVAVDQRSGARRAAHVADRAQRPADQPLDLLRPAALLARGASRSMRSGDEPGSIEYSAVTQPLPLPRIQRGTSSSTDAVHSTVVSGRR